MKTKPKPRRKSKKVAGLFSGGAAIAADQSAKLTLLTAFPITVDKPVTVLVPRPKKRRSKKEKEDEDEALVIPGINYNRNLPVKFDVYVNDEDQDSTSGPDK